MITPRTIAVENWGTWQRGQLRLDMPGITFLRGRNHDAHDTANGAGKSSLVNALYAQTYGEHQLIQKKNNLRQLTRDDTRIRHCFHADAVPVVADLKGKNFRVTIGGREIRAEGDARVRGADREELLRRMGIGPELWSATVHVNGVASNPLVRGTSKSRCEFLEKAFDLDRWVDDYRRCGDALASMRRVRDELDRAKGDLAALARDDVEKLDAQCSALRTRLRHGEELLVRTREQLAVAAALPPRPPRSVASYADVVRTGERRLEESITHERDESAWRETSMRRRRIEEEIAALPTFAGPLHDLDALEREVHRLDAVRRDALLVSSAIPLVHSWRDVAARIARQHGIHWKTLEQLRALSTTWVDNLRDGDGTCPVCGGDLARPVSGDDLRLLGERLARLPSGPLPAPRDVPNIARLEARLDRVRIACAEEKSRARAHERREQLVRDLRSVVVPPRPARTESAERIRDALDRARDLLHAARQWERVAGDPGDAEELRVRIARLRTRTDALRAELEPLEARLRRARDDAERRDALEKRIDELESEIALMPAYRALQSAYSPTGMRLWLLGELLEGITGGLNECVRGQRDRVEFGYRLGRNRDLTIIASNLAGTFDVRLLSGAEANMFCMNLLCVLLPLLPSRRRSNLLILDELDANCDDVTCAKIAREYLPRLARSCQSLMVITPNTRDVIDVPGARTLVVHKKNGISYLENRA